MGEHPLAHYRRKRAHRGHIHAPTHQKTCLLRSFLRPAGLPRQLIEEKHWLREQGVKKGLCLQSSRVSQALGLDEINFAKVW